LPIIFFERFDVRRAIDSGEQVRHAQLWVANLIASVRARRTELERNIQDLAFARAKKPLRALAFGRARIVRHYDVPPGSVG
jgi:hypothetical protein